MTTYLYKNLSGSHGSPVFRDNAGAHSVLQLLSDASADGSEAASNTEAAAANAAVSGSAASAASASGNSKTAARQGEYSEVRGSESAKQKDGGREKFEKLIRGEFKELYEERIRDTIRKRLKNSQQAVSRLEEISPILNRLAAHCGIDPSDTEALSEAVGSLISVSEQAPAEPASGENSSVQTESADRAPDKTENPEKTEIAAASEKSAVSGNTAAAEKNMQDGKTNIADTECKPDADMKKHFGYEAAKERFIRANAGKQCRTWLKQADEASGIYPGFNFHRELQNPRFCAILKNGIDVRTAYEVIHHDEIIPAALRCAVLDAEKKLSNKLMSNEARPAENGSGAGAGATLGTDVSKMSKANRDDIVRRVMRGEIIRL